VGVDEGIRHLFAHTECEVNHTSNIVVIEEGVPVESTVTELVHYSTGRLIEILKLELKLEMGDLNERHRWLTLEQIFIERRLYKNIEECTSWEAVREQVRVSLLPFLEKGFEVTEDDLDKLLSLKIRRISRFDINEHHSEMDAIRTRLKEVAACLRDIVSYAVSYVEGLLAKFGDAYPRLTSVESFTGINVKQVALRHLKAGFDPSGGFLGTSIKGEFSYNVSEYDRFVFFLDNGTYRVIPVQDKYFIDGKVLYCGVLDKARVFTAVYREKETRIAYIKRFRVESFILDKEYRFVPEGATPICFTHEAEMRLDFWFERSARTKRRKDGCLISAFKVTGESAKGVQLCGKKIVSSISASPVQDAGETLPAAGESPVCGPGPVAPEVIAAPEEIQPGEEEEPRDGSETPPLDGSGTTPPGDSDAPLTSPDDLLKMADDFRKRSAETLRRAENPPEEQGSLF
jgi:topoisomerase-4 subunit A